ncbi:isocitrate dehydrogenase [NAD] subunit gamma, mitochondrial-like [Chrysoperla carnea]|uniref:isocitrate dehydrogenase [NAD] subunit gamma, mitochondrial-like n=1 Tax=Chrysoperla carnea TaxID=189513 RepID=UPI001D08DDF4|nr:isocitrate dehydrogenase [NAD] subunit gamma, mitochondrial-like [Chrysoperla carnea]
MSNFFKMMNSYKYVVRSTRKRSILINFIQQRSVCVDKCIDPVQYKTPLVKKVSKIQRAKYGGRQVVTMIPGVGIGPEVMQQVLNVFKFAGAPINFEVIHLDGSSTNEDFEIALTSIRRNGIAIIGHLDKRHLNTREGIPSIPRNVSLRNELDLFVNCIHCHSLPVPSSRKRIDLVIIRQNTEGEYSMLEHETVRGVIESLKIITRSNTERVARFAFNYARAHKRSRVTTVHKANTMKLSDGLFLETTKRIAQEYPDIIHDDVIVDNCCMHLVSNNAQYDILIMPNLYGTIISNIVCGIMGGPGLFAGVNYGDHYAVFEAATRNIASSIAGKNIANPVAMLSAGVKLLEHLGYTKHSNAIRYAILKTIFIDEIRTPDIGGTATTEDVTSAVNTNISALTPRIW